MMYKHLFGPVPSRRLGMSLGVDMVPRKVCTLNCVYCEAGRTTLLTTQRKEYVPEREIIRELKDFFANHPDPDIITFSGYGEPTLNSALESIISYLKAEKPDLPVAVLTNGTMLSDPAVRQSLLGADLVLPSLDAATEEVFKKINRPSDTLDLQSYIGGLADFRKEFKGRIWLEVFILPGYNNHKAELDALKEAILRINPDSVQLNTLDRPGTVEGIRSATRQELEEIREYWNIPGVEIISSPASGNSATVYREDVQNAILETISRRPCTLEDIAHITGLHVNEINKYLSALEATGTIRTERLERGLFYMPAQRNK
ncbi:MAG: molybdenum cofactor biosynthesis protein A [Bacteroidetes bacterium ADurb.Bin139]|nr:MAG: molybdenum cofactor biosynthesis protein A [Bacteroidetes bacterium ADurb.Bin139]HOZ19384.1 radical SAM protein [Bacteroidales bacterium]